MGISSSASFYLSKVGAPDIKREARPTKSHHMITPISRNTSQAYLGPGGPRETCDIRFTSHIEHALSTNQTLEGKLNWEVTSSQAKRKGYCSKITNP